jgi:hypothetical protein
MLAAVLLAWGAPDAPAPPMHDRYAWTAPAACPDAAELHAAIEHYVDRPLDRPDDLAIRSTGRIERAEDTLRFRLHLRIEAQQSEPVEFVLEDDDCRVLWSAAALMIAVALDPKAAARASQPPPVVPAKSPAPAPAPAPVPTVAPAPAAMPSGHRPPRRCRARMSALRRTPLDLRPCVSLGARVGVQLGVLPETFGPGVGGDAALLWPRLRVELGGRHWFRRSARIEGGRGADLRLSTASLGACARLARRKLEFPLCAGLEIGALRGRGVGVDVPQVDRLLWVAGWLGPRLAWVPVRRLELFTAVDLLLPTARYRFVLDDVGPVHHVGLVGGRVSWGVSLRL